MRVLINFVTIVLCSLLLVGCQGAIESFFGEPTTPPTANPSPSPALPPGGPDPVEGPISTVFLKDVKVSSGRSKSIGSSNHAGDFRLNNDQFQVTGASLSAKIGLSAKKR